MEARLVRRGRLGRLGWKVGSKALIASNGCRFRNPFAIPTWFFALAAHPDGAGTPCPALPWTTKVTGTGLNFNGERIRQLQPCLFNETSRVLRLTLPDFR